MKDYRVIKAVKPNHVCDLDSPQFFEVGTIIECNVCLRRWKMARLGESYKEWRQTIPSRIFNGRAKSIYAPVGILVLTKKED